MLIRCKISSVLLQSMHNSNSITKILSHLCMFIYFLFPLCEHHSIEWMPSRRHRCENREKSADNNGTKLLIASKLVTLNLLIGGACSISTLQLLVNRTHDSPFDGNSNVFLICHRPQDIHCRNVYNYDLHP